MQGVCLDENSCSSASFETSQKHTSSPQNIVLQPIEDMPSHLTFNAHILHGYRGPFPLTAAECLSSVKLLHNETGNILTHLLAVFVMAGIAGAWAWDSEIPSFVVSVLLLCTIFINSVLYHTFIPHHSESYYYRWLALDYAPIFLLMAVTPLLIVVRFGLVCEPEAALYCYIGYALICVLALGCLLYKPCFKGTPGSAAERLQGFAAQLIGRIAIYIIRAGLDAGSDTALYWYSAAEVLSVVGGIINALKIPERWAPGKFDYICNSHQIMHCFAATALVCLYFAFLEDSKWYKGATC